MESSPQVSPQFPKANSPLTPGLDDELGLSRGWVLQVRFHAAQGGVLDILAGDEALVEGRSLLWLPVPGEPGGSRAHSEQSHHQPEQALCLAQSPAVPLECCMRPSQVLSIAIYTNTLY